MPQSARATEAVARAPTETINVKHALPSLMPRREARREPDLKTRLAPLCCKLCLEAAVPARHADHRAVVADGGAGVAFRACASIVVTMANAGGLRGSTHSGSVPAQRGTVRRSHQPKSACRPRRLGHEPPSPGPCPRAPVAIAVANAAATSSPGARAVVAASHVPRTSTQKGKEVSAEAGLAERVRGCARGRDAPGRLGTRGKRLGKKGVSYGPATGLANTP